MKRLLICFSVVMAATVVGAFHLPGTVAAKQVHSTSELSAATISSSTTSSETASPSSVGKRKTAVIVGAGPVGLAAALTLSNTPHNYDVKVIEQSTKRVKFYDPARAYLYNVNLRGQQWLSMFPSAMKKLQERGVVSRMDSLVVVPGDPSVPVPQPKTAVSSLAGSDKNITAVEVPVMASFWIPRHEMVNLLEETIEEEQQEKDETGRGEILMISSKKCIDVKALPDGKAQVVVQDTKSPDTPFENFYTADLVVGADGMNSDVRGALSDDSSIEKSSWVNMDRSKFRVRAWRSPSSGLRMKVLQFPPGFSIPNQEVDIMTTSQTMYAIQGVRKGPRDAVRLGFLPVKKEDAVRTGNVILPPNHNVWKLKTGEECRDWFQGAFPRLDWDKLIPPDSTEWDRFAQAKGTMFPPCQYCPKLQVAPPGGDSGVVLVGDAIHAFPPDIGQGINAGFGDVVALDRALKGEDLLTGARPTANISDEEVPPPTVSQALQEYERVRGPEIRSLIRLARFGAPYQYNQPLRKDKVGKMLWKANVAMRMLLNKLSFGLVSKPAILLTFGNNLTFRQAMRRADTTTGLLLSVATLLLLPWLRILIRPMLVT